MDKGKETVGIGEDLFYCFLVKYIIAPLTPILGVSDQCFEQSIAYMQYLIPGDNGWFDIWAIRSKAKLSTYKILRHFISLVLDSTGKIPDGILADVSYFCDIMDGFVYPNFCNIRDALITNDSVEAIIEQNFVIPRGNTIAFGSFEGTAGILLRQLCHSCYYCDFIYCYCYFYSLLHYLESNSCTYQTIIPIYSGNIHCIHSR